MAMTNESQDAYWNGETGALWAREAAQLDALLEPFLTPILERTAQQRPKSILDIGCGAGALTLAAARQHPEAGITGVDLSAPLLKIARKRGEDDASGAIFFRSDATKFSSFEPIDAMISRFGIMFFPEPQRAFEKLRTMMAPGGVFAAACWQEMDKNDWMTVPLKAAVPYLKRPPEQGDPHAPGPFSLADKDRTVAILEAAGWSDVTVTPWTGQLILPGNTVQDAADFSMKIGPLSSLMREQELDPEVLRGAVEEALSEACNNKGVCALNAAAWILRARAL